MMRFVGRESVWWLVGTLHFFNSISSRFLTWCIAYDKIRICSSPFLLWIFIGMNARASPLPSIAHFFLDRLSSFSCR
ncbi:hypothetical protein C8R45DRAFT_1032906 [Mycena sanguinolenta]|nr:hypothetical protein C8R45DRAFT_1032906 [Mycena sanguinolenta]